MTSTLNQGQSAAAEGFLEFLLADNEREMKVSGPGGTGKTHLMSNMIDSIMPRYFELCGIMGIEPKYDGVHMTATTNKAAEVLAIATQRPTSTLASLLCLKVTEDYSTGETKLTRRNDWKPHEKKIIFVDEYTMMDTGMLNAVRDAAIDCKIIYVGDHCQLSPVTEAICPVDKLNIRTYELTEQMRTSVPEFKALHEQLRYQVENNEFYPIEIKPGVIDWLDDDQMQSMIDQTFAQQTKASKILSYTNARVNQFNDHIRSLRHLPDEYTVGELLVSNSMVNIGKKRISIEQELEVIELAHRSTFIEVDTAGTKLEVVYATLGMSSGGYVEKVPIPVDRDHFNKLVKYYQRRKQWPEYFNLKGTFPDLRPLDSSTVHKSQGSTYDSVFVDLGNISTCPNPNMVARMLYVALSRPRHRIFLYGNLADKYGGLHF
jgi:hypothetical protein